MFVKSIDVHKYAWNKQPAMQTQDFVKKCHDKNKGKKIVCCLVCWF